MAQIFYGMNRGQKLEQVVQDVATQGTDVEIRYDTSTMPLKSEVLDQLEQIKLKILQDDFPAS